MPAQDVSFEASNHGDRFELPVVTPLYKNSSGVCFGPEITGGTEAV